MAFNKGNYISRAAVVALGKMLEHSPRHIEVVGSNPTGCRSSLKHVTHKGSVQLVFSEKMDALLCIAITSLILAYWEK